MARIFLFAWIFLAGCTAYVHTEFYKPSPATQPPAVSRSSIRCQDWPPYVPNATQLPYLPMRYLRVNFHVMDNAAGNAHLPPDSVRPFLLEVLRLANAQLDTNVGNWRSPDNTPTLPKLYRYVLTPQPVPGDDGIYFHYDDAHWYFISQGKNQNNYSREVVNKYGIGTDSIINIFVQVHPPDSIASPTYRANSQGIALGTGLKMAGLLEFGKPPGEFPGLLNHEIGHILGLSHAWTEDNCPDTNNHPNNCWAWTEQPPCSANASNNTMDYNAYQIALTPCQIGKIHATFANPQSPIRRCLEPTWCKLQPERTIFIRDSVNWSGARDLEGNLIVESNAALRIACRVSMPPGSYILLKPGARLWLDGARLHNDCNQSWRGIMLQSLDALKASVHEIKPSSLENLQ